MHLECLDESPMHAKPPMHVAGEMPHYSQLSHMSCEGDLGQALNVSEA